MHGYSKEVADLARAVFDYALFRVSMDPPPLDGWMSEAELDAAGGRTVTPGGMGSAAALRLFTDVLSRACISQDSPRYLSFVPCAPTEASTLFDLVVSASCIYGGSWVEASGAIWAENAALRWLCDLADLPPEAGGVFLSGGTAANLSALVAARYRWRRDGAGGGDSRAPALIAVSDEAHASIAAAARVMDADLLDVPSVGGRLTGDSVSGVLGDAGDRICAVVATGGTTNAGLVDDLAGIAAACRDAGVWLHVDAAYGGAALAAPSVRGRFDGIEWADSITIDPHKWLFAPYDCAALLYRDPLLAREAHAQKASYLDVVTRRPEWNPSEFAYHLSRRARGLPFWFSLAAHGTDAYSEAVETTLRTTRVAAEMIRAHPRLELVMEPELSVVLFRRTGWSEDRYHEWSMSLVRDGIALVVPTSHDGEPVLRFCIVNPTTTDSDIGAILETL